VTKVPPPRWKVVERGRRLEVIDLHAAGGQAPMRRDLLRLDVAPRGPARRDPASSGTAGLGTDRPGLPRRLRFDGTLGWTTHPFYDERGPRAVVLDGTLARWFGGVAAVAALALVAATLLIGTSFIVVAVVIAASAGKNLRAWSTRRLDAIAAP